MKTSVSLRAPRLVALLAFAFASLSVSTLSAQNATVSTVPVGYMSFSLSGAVSASVPRYTAVSLPLADGIIYRGTLASVNSATSLTVTNTVTDTFTSTTPYLLKLTSGAHQGRTFVISSNTGSALTVNNDGTPLNTLSPALTVGASGDKFIIYPADTLSGVFGSSTLGSTSAANADQVWVWQPSSARYNKYYYNTTNSRWQESVFQTPSNTLVLRPDAGILFLRRGLTALTIEATGEVPTTETRVQVRDSGSTYVATSLPADTNLVNLGLQNKASWVKGTSAAASDQVWVWQTSSARFNKYYYNTTNNRWQETVFQTASSTLPIPAGTPVFLKKAAASGSTFTTIALDLPPAYNIN
jgi:uncharacterized protein (TIGR02597 family)